MTPYRSVALRKEAEESLSSLGLLQHLPIGVCLLADDLTVLAWNECLEDWTGLRAGQVVGRSILTFAPTLAEPFYRRRMDAVFLGGPPAVFSSQLDRPILPSHFPDGTVRVHQYFVTAVPSGRHGRFDALVSVQDVTELTQRVRAQRQLRDRAIEDAAIRSGIGRVAETLIEGMRGKPLLDSLCAVTMEVLDVDFAHVLRRERGRDGYEWVAGCERNPRRLAAFRQVRLDAPLVDAELAAIRGGDLLTTVPGERTTDLGRIEHGLGMVRVLHAGVRQGAVLDGVLTVGYRRTGYKFTARQEAMLRGISQMASLALETARRGEELDRTAEEKAYFASILSHELRSTFAVVNGVSTMLAAEVEGLPQDVQDLVGILARRSEEGLEMIEITLELTRSVKGRRQPWREIALGVLAAELRENTTLPPGREGVSLEWSVPSPGVVLRTDHVKVRMIIKNLVGNAAKFTTVGRIVVTLAVDGEDLVVTVADTGIGIPSEQVATLFEAFQQAHGEHSRQAGGVGLGLFIVHRLARSMDGAIDIQSAEGQGTTVTVRLPGQVLSEKS